MRPLITSVFSALCSFALAAPQSEQAFPALSSSSQLAFYVNVTANDLTPSLTGQILHQQLDADPNYWDLAVLPTSGGPGQDNFFYPNGTADQIASGMTTMGAYSTYPPFIPAIKLDQLSQMGPNGVTVASVVHNVTGSSPPLIWMFPPTLGVAVSAEDGYAKLLAPNNRQWYVCVQKRFAHSAEFTLYLVYTRAADEATPAACADVNLIPQCTSFDFDPKYVYAGGQYAFEASCYEDASVIWT